MTHPPADSRAPRRRRQNAYICVDGMDIACRYDTVKGGKEAKMTVPWNGILLRPGASPVAVIARTQTNREIGRASCRERVFRAV